MAIIRITDNFVRIGEDEVRFDHNMQAVFGRCSDNLIERYKERAKRIAIIEYREEHGIIIDQHYIESKVDGFYVWSIRDNAGKNQEVGRAPIDDIIFPNLPDCDGYVRLIPVNEHEYSIGFSGGEEEVDQLVTAVQKISLEGMVVGPYTSPSTNRRGRNPREGVQICYTNDHQAFYGDI